MAEFDRPSVAARPGTAAVVDEGLRSYMLRVYNYMGIGLVVTVAIDRASGGAMMSGIGLLLVPVTVALMVVVGLLAATGPARHGLRVQPTEALRAE